MAFLAETSNPHQKASAAPVTVLLCNLGTPETATSSALRPYLKQFLSDPRVVEVPRIIWWFILRLFILPFRPKASAKLYQQVWTNEGSPLLVTSKAQQKLLQNSLDSVYGSGQYHVELAMNYGAPSFEQAIAKQRQSFSNKLIVLPLYPQYSGATTASAFDALSAELQHSRWVPSLKFINSYHDHPLYIQALKQSVIRHFEKHGRPDKLILSYHGTPKAYLDKGDPYHCFCMKTSRLLAETLELKESEYETTFQSRFGKQEWLQPYTDIRLQQLPAEGAKKLAIICPGFSADCLETLEEILVENKEVFLSSGGESYEYIPCLNEQGSHIELMRCLVEENAFVDHQSTLPKIVDRVA
ncbi:ferrochelatase [uncultured Pseudoteredinibacter sp.]|uniref:ferrochelatase n=1 Tax=uncultured Pseudoteredinibacter sp. TaxID=1641701 RepID=UPI00260F718B|nr:ferrochelatase [uncultured Pseudoteredinibacter sp.]